MPLQETVPYKIEKTIITQKRPQITMMLIDVAKDHNKAEA